jgi:hypothetical protein
MSDESSAPCSGVTRAVNDSTTPDAPFNSPGEPSEGLRRIADSMGNVLEFHEDDMIDVPADSSDDELPEDSLEDEHSEVLDAVEELARVARRYRADAVTMRARLSNAVKDHNALIADLVAIAEVLGVEPNKEAVIAEIAKHNGLMDTATAQLDKANKALKQAMSHIEAVELTKTFEGMIALLARDARAADAARNYVELRMDWDPGLNPKLPFHRVAITFYRDGGLSPHERAEKVVQDMRDLLLASAAFTYWRGQDNFDALRDAVAKAKATINEQFKALDLKVSAGADTFDPPARIVAP